MAVSQPLFENVVTILHYLVCAFNELLNYFDLFNELLNYFDLFNELLNYF
jgi:hypothetical protein